MQHLQNEWTSEPRFDFVADFRWDLAMHIIGHCAMVTAVESGEDSHGRQKLALLGAKETAARALDIADAMVSAADERGWFKKPTVTMEQRARFGGLLEKLRLHAGYNEKDDSKLKELMALIADFTKQPAGVR